MASVFTIKLSSNEGDIITAMAKKELRSATSLIRIAITEYIENRKGFTAQTQVEPQLASVKKQAKPSAVKVGKIDVMDEWDTETQ